MDDSSSDGDVFILHDRGEKEKRRIWEKVNFVRITMNRRGYYCGMTKISEQI
jgi:hypothetical protein